MTFLLVEEEICLVNCVAETKQKSHPHHPPQSRAEEEEENFPFSRNFSPPSLSPFPLIVEKRINKKGILSLICGVCFRLNFDWDGIRLLTDSHQKKNQSFALMHPFLRKVLSGCTLFEENFSLDAPVLKKSFL